MNNEERNHLALLSAAALLERRGILDIDTLTPLELKAYAFLRSMEATRLRREMEHLKEALRQTSRELESLKRKVEDETAMRRTRSLVRHPVRRKSPDGTAEKIHRLNV